MQGRGFEWKVNIIKWVNTKFSGFYSQIHIECTDILHVCEFIIFKD